MSSLDSQQKKELESERKKFNLQLLKRHDETISEVIANSSYVSVYLMDENSQKWVRGEVEGFLHIVKRDIEPTYQLIVLNQKNPENVVSGISSDWELIGETNYLFYKPQKSDPNSALSCLWFYEEEERISIQDSLKDIIANLMVDNSNDESGNAEPNFEYQPEPGFIYDNNAGKSILKFVNNNSKSNDISHDREVNIEQMIRDSVRNNNMKMMEKNNVANNKITNNNNNNHSNKNNNNKNNNTSKNNKGNNNNNSNASNNKNNSNNNNNNNSSKSNNSGKNINNGDSHVEKKGISEKKAVDDPLQRLLQSQGILGNSSQLECNSKQRNENITPEAIIDIVKDVLSSKQVYEMITERVELLLRK